MGALDGNHLMGEDGKFRPQRVRGTTAPVQVVSEGTPRGGGE